MWGRLQLNHENYLNSVTFLGANKLYYYNRTTDLSPSHPPTSFLTFKLPVSRHNGEQQSRQHQTSRHKETECAEQSPYNGNR